MTTRPLPGSRRVSLKLSAILSLPRFTPIPISFLLLILLAPIPAWGTDSAVCEPSPEIRAELAKAARVVSNPSDFDQNIAPYQALRERYPNDLTVHELYQDAVQRYGIEGHLRKVTEEYQVLSMQHSDKMMYDYLYGRSLLGRNTPAAIQQIGKILAEHPDFAPGHASLAEIYASTTFRDAEKEKIERLRFLALCPGSVLQQRPSALPAPSSLVDQAERLLAGNGDPDRIAGMALQGVRDDEWHLQRIRPFDWYSVAEKFQAQRELQAKYWRVWSLQVRCDRRAGRPEQAAALLAQMEQRATSLERTSDAVYWDALTTLARLYEEGNQRDSADRKLESMRQFLDRHPDPQRMAELETLRNQIAAQAR